MINLPSKLNLWRQSFEERFEAIQNTLYSEDHSLHQACRYALAGQGKRIRPLFAMAAAEACSGRPEDALSLAVAAEMIHTYSLVHDDLPCMDDDDMRRGRATTHVIFDETTALLAGDALLSDAFLVVANDRELSAEIRANAVAQLAMAAGGRGMVKGQALDMYWTGRNDFTRADLDSIHLNKTGALIAASCSLGGLAAGATSTQVQTLEAFGRGIGLVFQIIDDLLDTAEGTGKSLGKDANLGKLTYLSLMTAEAAKNHAARLTDETLALVSSWGSQADALKQLGLSLLERKV
ncbi:MAG: polyprenyl synthetase family protein [Oligoflexus sp.]|nr:polyprenyl synthetase family protein [Oligoflexus sp.]